MKVIVYGRVNHADNEAMSMQVDMLKRYCRNRGYKITCVMTEFSSGRKIGKCLNQFLNANTMNEADAIVVQNFSCITKDYRKLLGFMEVLEEKKVRLISLDKQVVEPQSALWKMLWKK